MPTVQLAFKVRSFSVSQAVRQRTLDGRISLDYERRQPRSCRHFSSGLPLTMSDIILGVFWLTGEISATVWASSWNKFQQLILVWCGENCSGNNATEVRNKTTTFITNMKVNLTLQDQ